MPTGYNVKIGTISVEKPIGYLRIKTKNGWKKLHRFIIENKIGRPLTPSELVHHKDGNGLNNKLSNLMIVSRSEHRQLHLKGGKS